MSEDRLLRRESTSKPDNSEKEAMDLARTHLFTHTPGEPGWLVDSLRSEDTLLRQAYQYFLKLSVKEFSQSYAAEWLLDNFHIVQQALREILHDMPAKFYMRLPKLTAPPGAGKPRIYAVAVEILERCGGLLQIEELTRFVEAYQEISVLEIGELWALPVMCRVAVLESLTQAVSHVAGFPQASATNGAEVQSSPERPPDENTVANAILSLRTLAALDWRDVFERLSHVEQILQTDPCHAYASMDFETRDLYRKQVEKLSHTANQSESDVALAAVRLAQHSSTGADPEDRRQSHVGYYLIGAGRPRLETQLGYIPSPGERALRRVLGRPTSFYLGSIGVVALLIFLLLTGYVFEFGTALFPAPYIMLLAAIPVLVCATGFVNWSFTHLLPPRILPKLDFSKAIPAEYHTMVVIPALLTDVDEIDSLLSQIELHFLCNEDPQLTFALLTDFADAPRKEMEIDESLIERGTAGIKALNERYGGPFCLFHRERRWNESEGVWMGWERKRGKIEEFNRLIRGEGATSYTVQIGSLERLARVRYVITLDADTVLPRGAAHRLIGTLAHPLNHPKFDERTGEVAAGYAVLQPRIQIKPSSANQSYFARIFAGDTGFDLYTRAVSDVYEDLFGEGIYVGKGIYDVSAFERGLAGRVPPNALLSHDLFEGLHVGVALVTDITLVEEYPPGYIVYARRLHRWIRGDWQLLPWLFYRLPYPGRNRRPHRFAPIALWKIVDNLLRSLFPPALFSLLILAWLGVLGSALSWTLFVFLASATPLLGSVASELTGHIKGGSLRGIGSSLRLPALRWLLMVTFLPYEAVTAVDAVLRTLFRLTITRKHLLQWMTAAHTIRLFGKEHTSFVVWQEMGTAPLLVAGLAILLAIFRPMVLLPALPILFIWFVSPQIAYKISHPLKKDRELLTLGQRYQMRRLARRTWFYFEQFVGPEDQWLPPDHFQESPGGHPAHRTSPTNVGLMLLSALAAYDLGYIGVTALAARLLPAFETMEKLERYRGHFLNWYDTRTAQPLFPRYVSTVDSGNLAACLLTLREGCIAMGNAPLIRWQHLQGLLDTLDVLDEVAEQLEQSAPGAVSSLQANWGRIRQTVLSARDNPASWAALLQSLEEEERPELDRHLMALVESKGSDIDTQLLNSLRLWIERIHYQLHIGRRDISDLVSWLPILDRVPAIVTRLAHPGAAVAWNELKNSLPSTPRLDEVQDVCRTADALLTRLQSELPRAITHDEDLQAAMAWSNRLADGLKEAALNASELLNSFHELGRRADAYADGMGFGFLLDRQRQLFHIGFNVDTGQLDSNYYDLLASESRLASLVAVAKGDVPQSHWLHLNRPLAAVNGSVGLLSWSGSMFEYLMPTLFTQEYDDSLLGSADIAAIERQIAYGRKKGVPWGISESGYYQFDQHMNYQYRAFGAPGLGFKRGLEDDLVIAPYASLLALAYRPKAVMDNVGSLIRKGMLGNYGLYEAIDYTPSRLALGKKEAIVRSFYTHHQGMLFLSIVNYLLEGVMIRRFHSDPRLKSIELLLQEQVPKKAELEDNVSEDTGSPLEARTKVGLASWPVPVHTSFPQVHFLSNGEYGVLVTNGGGGASVWRDTALTRWRADTTLDNWGTWIYIKDHETNELWSTGYQPTAVPAQMREVSFAPDKVEFRTQIEDLVVNLEITVSPQEPVEIRRLTITNRSARPRRFTVSSFGEVVLAPKDVDRRHPAFNKLFIESEYVSDLNALLFRRRARSAEEAPLFMVHGLALENEREAQRTLYDTDRMRFVGRHRTCANPEIFDEEGARFSATMGATLDPIMALGRECELEPNEAVRLAYYTLAARSLKHAFLLAGQYKNWTAVDRAFSQIRAQSELELSNLELTTRDLQLIQELLSVLLYPHLAVRAEAQTLAANSKGQSDLWPFAISGDYPILLVTIAKEEELPLIHELLRAHTYWRNRGLKIDLVILNTREMSYMQELHGQLLRLLSKTGSDAWQNRRGGIFILRGDQLSENDHALLRTVARAVLEGDKGSLAEQVRRFQEPTQLPAFVPVLSEAEQEEPTPALLRPAGLLWDNGIGGFAPDGSEYVIYLEPGRTTPVPWINVIANPYFGFLVSEGGLGCTWAVNASENRLTPWNNDPVSDTPAEALYIRDEETAEVWSPTPLPAGDRAPYLIRHGTGYTIFEHHSHGLKQRVRLFTALDDPVKFLQVRLENTRKRVRRITVTYYVEWVLGTDRESMQPYIISEFDEIGQALLARNSYNTEFGAPVAFVCSDREIHGLTASRTEFLGRMGNLKKPAALGRIGLAGNTQPGTDPCGALQVHVDLPPGGASDICFLMGQGADRQHALGLLSHYRLDGKAEAAWGRMKSFWDGFVDTVTVETPDAAMNHLLNRWLPYQTLSCRLWARSAFYQSSGAYGFRDQLQDIMAFMHARPEFARQEILQAAAHQFEEGDVLHWWHPPSGRGVRTRISDDLLWLPFVTAHYVKTTGDGSILAESVPFIKGKVLESEEEERYGRYETTSERYSLFEHCLRAIRKASTAGPRGLPLMGAGDWNDGMNRVGIKGIGESVWLGWFLYATLMDFAHICDTKDEGVQAAGFRERAEHLRQSIESNAWDGNWYVRAYYDYGVPLGSSRSRECQIDSIAQSWAVLSGAGVPSHCEAAMRSVNERLVKPEAQLIQLLDPPFDKTPHDPGYIKGYPPGIRENGGQYTHAALWSVWACAQLGDGDLAEKLFRMLNPIYHSDTPDKVERYKVEPYVVASDVYSRPPYTGRGGWTWYTGAAGWMYRVGIEAILGIRRAGNLMTVDPCIPKEWPEYYVRYRFGKTSYRIHVQNPERLNTGVIEVTLDGNVLPEKRVVLLDDGREHEISVKIGRARNIS